MTRTTNLQANDDGYRLHRKTDDMVGLQLSENIGKPVQQETAQDEEDAVLALYHADNGLYVGE